MANTLADITAKVMPKSGGDIASLTIGGKNVVRSVNGSTADASGNVNVSVVSSILPDLTAGVSLAANTAAPSDGWVFVKKIVDENYWSLKMDDVLVGYNGGSKLQGNSEFLLIAKGSSINYDSTFYPCKGA